MSALVTFFCALIGLCMFLTFRGLLWLLMGFCGIQKGAFNQALYWVMP
jgi:hypothetical protein